MKEENNTHKEIFDFNPDVEVYNQKRQDLLLRFDAGNYCKTIRALIRAPIDLHFYDFSLCLYDA